MSEVVSPSRSRVLILILCVIVPLLAVSLAGWRYAHPDLARYDQVLNAIRTRQINVDSDGRVDLSRQFPGLCPQDMALVTYLEEGQFRAVFPTYRDKDATLAGLMYTSRLLEEDDTRPRTSAIHFDERMIKVGSYSSLLLEKKLDDHWYKVSYRIH